MHGRRDDRAVDPAQQMGTPLLISRRRAAASPPAGERCGAQRRRAAGQALLPPWTAQGGAHRSAAGRDRPHARDQRSDGARRPRSLTRFNPPICESLAPQCWASRPRRACGGHAGGAEQARRSRRRRCLAPSGVSLANPGSAVIRDGTIVSDARVVVGRGVGIERCRSGSDNRITPKKTSVCGPCTRFQRDAPAGAQPAGASPRRLPLRQAVKPPGAALAAGAP